MTKIIIIHIGDQESLEGDEAFESTILKNRQIEKNNDVEVSIFKLDDLETFISETSNYNNKKLHKSIQKKLAQLQSGDKIFILSHGKPDSEMIGNSTHYSVLGNYLAKGLKKQNFKDHPLKISVHACRAAKGSKQGKKSFTGLLHYHLGKLNINSEVTGRTELVHIDEAKYSATGGGILTITPIKHVFSIVYQLLNVKVPDNWYKYKKPGTKVKFSWDKQGRQIKHDHYISKYNDHVFLCLDNLAKYYDEKYYIKSNIKIINNIKKNLYKEKYSITSKNINTLLSLIKENNNPKIRKIYAELSKYNQNILIKHQNSFQKTIFKNRKFKEHLPRNYIAIEQLVNNNISMLDEEIKKINKFKCSRDSISVLNTIRDDLYKHLRHQYVYPYIPQFSIKQAKKIIERVTEVTRIVFNEHNETNTEALQIKQQAIENFIQKNAKYLKSSKLLKTKYIFAGLKEGIIEAIKEGGKETIINIFIKANQNAKFRLSYFDSYKSQLKQITNHLTQDSRFNHHSN